MDIHPIRERLNIATATQKTAPAEELRPSTLGNLYLEIRLHKDLRLTAVPTGPHYDPTASPSTLQRVEACPALKPPPPDEVATLGVRIPPGAGGSHPCPLFLSPFSSLSPRWWIFPMCARGSSGGGPLAHLPHARSTEGPPPAALPCSPSG